MDPVTVDTKDLTNKSKSYGKYIGELMLQSLRKQRRDNIFCDVTIQCEDGQIFAHRCVLYAISDYCRTLLTGSLPPTFKDGICIMELSSFSSDTIEVFVDLIYDEESSSVRKINVGELLKLCDYLQVPALITTEILRGIINKENCVTLHELSLYYNCSPFQKILETFICNHLEELVNGSNWKISEKALSSFQKNPLYLSKPQQLIGVKVKELAHDMDMKYMMIAYNKTLYPSAKASVCSVKSGSEIARHKEFMSFHLSEIVYFVYQYQLFCIVSATNEISHRIYKYNQHEEKFSSVVDLSDSNNPTPDDCLKLPSYLPTLMVKIVITVPTSKSIYIVFVPKGSGLWLMKLSLDKPSIKFVEKIDGINCWSDHYSSIYHNHCIYFLNDSEYFKYNIVKRSLRKQIFQDFADEDVIPYCEYCKFKGVIYLITLSPPETLKVYSLNEKDICMVLLSEHTISQMSGCDVIESRALSSQNELLLVLDLALDSHKDEDEYVNGNYDDLSTVICHYDPANRNLVVEDKVNGFGGEYMFVPEHLFI